MIKIFHFISQNILFLLTLFFLAFIPLYPKLPLIDIKHTWVYIRLEDFLILIAGAIFIFGLIRKKVTFNTPLTLPIVVFWSIGAISTIYAIFFIFPHIANVFTNVAILSFFRRIEYILLFFIAFASVKSKKFEPYFIAVLAITLLLVVFYGVGQKVRPDIFRAFLTMNEEFAKGTPLQLSSLARIPSTFAGHYDLAAYLVLVIPIMGSMIFGYKNVLIKLFFAITGTLGLILLFMAVSRVSLIVFFVTILVVLVLQKKKFLMIPIIVFGIILLPIFSGTSQRLLGTISKADLVVDAQTTRPIGIAKNFSFEKVQKQGLPVLIEEIQSTGENLPQGTGYINIPVDRKEYVVDKILYKRSKLKDGVSITETTTMAGSFLVKRVLVYDISFTTRFQGEWPRAWEAFKRNVLLGSGYSSIGLATDNNYLRLLGEVGILGFLSFLSIFIVFLIYVKKILPYVTSSSSKSFAIGVVAGIFGLSLNAFFIDVFEASKVAYTLWMLIGITTGILFLYKKINIDYLLELKKIFFSKAFLIIYFFIVTFVLFSPTFQNYFVGDDFTWLRWASDCKKVQIQESVYECGPIQTTLSNYFLDSQGFFYRPGTKLFYFLMYAFFGMNSSPYHIASIFIHFVAVYLVFLLAKKLLKNNFFAGVSALFFLVLSAHTESLYWISTVGTVIASMLLISTLLFYIYWVDSKKGLFLVTSILSAALAMLFHEIGVIGPLLILAYDFIITKEEFFRGGYRRWHYYIYIFFIPLYLFIRGIANSHWFSGDYSYRLANLPYNFLGNLIGYFSLSLFGNPIISYYQDLRIFGRENIFLVLVLSIIVVAFLLFLGKALLKILNEKERKLVFFSLSFFVISLLPFLGLGNIAARYIYLGSLGVILLLVFFLQKAYYSFAENNKVLSKIVLFLFIFIFSFYHIMELYRVNNDWKKAGEVSNALLRNISDKFHKKEIPQNTSFYFINVPIRIGEAWVFPVGLADAIWFMFQNENIRVNLSNSRKDALDITRASANTRVFEFDSDYNISEVVK